MEGNADLHVVGESNVTPGDADQLEARAFLLGERIDMPRKGRRQHLPALMPLEVGWGMVFRWGAVVAIGVHDEIVLERFLDHVRPHVRGAYEQVQQEEIALQKNDGPDRVTDDAVLMNDFSAERLHIIGKILAQSVMLDHYEMTLTQTFERLRPLSQKLAEGRHAGTPRQLLKLIGEGLTAQHKIVGMAEIGEKPEVLWENPDLEKLYDRLEDEFELSERHAAIDRKIGVIASTLDVILSSINTTRSLRVEWYIVILIVADIVLGLWIHFS